MKTNVICRLYKDDGSAIGMKGRLQRAGFPRHVITVVSPADAERKGGLEGQIEAALVPAKAAKVYARKVTAGASLVVVRATYKPLNAVRIATEAFESSGAMSSGLESDRFWVKTPPDPSPSILKDHPRFLTPAPSSAWQVPRLSDQLGVKLLSAPKRRDSVQRPAKRIFGEGIRRGTRKTSTMAPGTYMSRFFWPTPLLSKRERNLSVIPGGGHPFSRLLSWPLPNSD